jgi:nitrogen PTS system EIIA component
MCARLSSLSALLPAPIILKMSCFGGGYGDIAAYLAGNREWATDATWDRKATTAFSGPKLVHGSPTGQHKLENVEQQPMPSRGSACRWGGISTVKIADFIAPDRVVPRLLGTNKRSVLKELARIGSACVDLDPAMVFDALLERQDSTTIGLGRGTAIPHATVAGIEAPVGVFARLQPPVDFGAVDGMPADLVVMILAPEDDNRMLLRALSCAARRLREGEVAARLRSANDSETLYAVLVSEIWSGAGDVEMSMRSSGT